MSDEELPVPAEQPEEPTGPSEQSAWEPPPWASSADGQGGSGGERSLATFWWRVLGYVIDGFIIALGSSLAAFALPRSTLVLLVVAVVANILYAGLLISLWNGQTVGMRVCRLRCVDAESWGPVAGGRPWVRATSAQLFEAVRFVWPPLLLVAAADLLWPLFDANNQTLHDKVAKTVVLREPAA